LFVIALSVFGGNAVAAASPRTSIAIIVPIVSATIANGSIGAPELEAATSPGGNWAILANAAIATGATIALDSRITASINRLGSDAPASAVTWLSTVERMNPINLPWGNADPFLLSMAAANHRVSTIQLSELSGIASSNIVGWPTGHAGVNHVLDRTKSLGFTTFIVDDKTFPNADGAYSSSVSQIIADAVAPGATSSLSDVVERIVREGLPTAAALPRNPADIDSSRAAQLLTELVNRGTVLTHYLPVALSTLPEPVLRSVPRAGIDLLLAQHRFDDRASAIGVNPSVIALPRLERICTLAGRVADPRFGAFIRSNDRINHYLNEIVSVQHGATFTILSNQAEVPLTVTNASATDVHVVLAVHPQTGSLHVTKSVFRLTIPANSNSQVTVPVQTVANGPTALVASILTEDGLNISGTTVLPIEVQAQWESVTLIGFIALVGSIMGVGIARQLRDRRRRA
jgi:hypothetical protein